MVYKIKVKYKRILFFIMSDSDFSSETSSDSEFEESLEEVRQQIWKDKESEIIMDEMQRLGLRVSTFDGKVVKEWLSGYLKLQDVIVSGHLKKQNSVLLKGPISEERVAEIREFARKVIDHYGKSLRYSSYVDRVTACIIKYQYRL